MRSLYEYGHIHTEWERLIQRLLFLPVTSCWPSSQLTLCRPVQKLFQCDLWNLSPHSATLSTVHWPLISLEIWCHKSKIGDTIEFSTPEKPKVQSCWLHHWLWLTKNVFEEQKGCYYMLLYNVRTHETITWGWIIFNELFAEFIA